MFESELASFSARESRHFKSCLFTMSLRFGVAISGFRRQAVRVEINFTSSPQRVLPAGFGKFYQKWAPVELNWL
jgi:hypothetical protein